MGYVNVSGVLDDIENFGVNVTNAENSAINNVLPVSMQAPMISTNDTSTAPSAPSLPSAPDVSSVGMSIGALVVGAAVLAGGAWLLLRHPKRRSNPGRRRRRARRY